MKKDNVANVVNHLDAAIAAAKERILVAEEKQRREDERRNQIEALHVDIDDKQEEIREIAVRRNTLTTLIAELNKLGDAATSLKKDVIAANIMINELQEDIKSIEGQIHILAGAPIQEKYQKENVIEMKPRYIAGFTNSPKVASSK